MALLALASEAPRALAEPLAEMGDRVDDPKIVRRVRREGGALAPSPAASAPSSVPAPAAAPPGIVAAPPGVVAAPKAGVAAPPGVVAAPPGPGPSAPGSTLPRSSAPPAPSPAPTVLEEPAPSAAPAAVTGTAPDAAVSAKSSPPREEPWPHAPRLELTWRHLPLFRVGAQENGDPAGKVANQGFQVLSGRFFPTSSLFRFGLGADFGWESGRFATKGDYFIAESTSLGLQRRGRVTPFFDVTAGGGYWRRLQVGVSVPTAVWFFGGEGGVDLYAADRLYVHLSVGRMRVVNGLAQLSGLARVFEDVWFFRAGLGL